jgi:O-antigen/teichoic acid export membrane protein
LASLQDVPAEGARPAGQTAGLGLRTLRNTAVVLTARVASRLLALLTIIVLEVHLRPAGFGLFGDVVNLSALATVFLDAGFNTLFQREAARNPGELSRYLNSLLSGRLVFGLLALIAFTALLAATGKLAFLLPAFLMMTLSSYSNLLRGALYAVQKLGFEAVAIVLESVVLLGLVFYGVKTQRGVDFFLWAYAGSYAFSCLYFTVVLAARRIVRFRWRFDLGFLRQWLWKGLPFAATFAITTIYFKIDVPILNYLRGDYETGLYVAAYKPFEALLFVPMSMLNVVFPVLAIYHRQAEGQVMWAVSRFFKSLLLLGWPIGVGVFMLVDALRPLYQFAGSASALRVLSVGIVFMFVSNAFIAALSAIDRQLSFTWAALASMVVNVSLNLALIPPFGYLGASWATVLTEVGLVVFAWLLTARHLGRVPVLAPSWRILAAGAVMGAALYPLRGVHGPLTLLAIAAGALVYGSMLLVLGAVDAEERGLIRRAVGR